jgi:hypothetical protein
LQHAGLYDNSDIIVKLKRPIQYITIIFKSKDDNKNYEIKCLKTEKICSIKSKLKMSCDLYSKDLVFNSKIISKDDLKKRAEELGIKDKSVIFVQYI